MQKVILVTAVANNSVIGSNTKLPWNIPEELAYFKSLTDGGVVIMGNTTFKSLKKPLINRLNIVITHSTTNYNNPYLTYVNSLNDALESVPENYDKVFIIGGSSIYDQALKSGIVDEMYISRIKHDFEGDAYLPLIVYENFNLLSEEEVICSGGINFIKEHWSK